jgi:hypothetical protein
LTVAFFHCLKNIITHKFLHHFLFKFTQKNHSAFLTLLINRNINKKKQFTKKFFVFSFKFYSTQFFNSVFYLHFPQGTSKFFISTPQLNPRCCHFYRLALVEIASKFTLPPSLVYLSRSLPTDRFLARFVELLTQNVFLRRRRRTEKKT